MRPLRHLERLTARQDAIAFFMNPRHVDTVSTLQTCLKHIRNTSVSCPHLAPESHFHMVKLVTVVVTVVVTVG